MSPAISRKWWNKPTFDSIPEQLPLSGYWLPIALGRNSDPSSPARPVHHCFALTVLKFSGLRITPWHFFSPFQPIGSAPMAPPRRLSALIPYGKSLGERRPGQCKHRFGDAEETPNRPPPPVSAILDTGQDRNFPVPPVQSLLHHKEPAKWRESCVERRYGGLEKKSRKTSPEHETPPREALGGVSSPRS